MRVSFLLLGKTVLFTEQLIPSKGIELLSMSHVEDTDNQEDETLFE